MERKGKYTPAMATHPGEILRCELEERHIALADFSEALNVDEGELSDFIHGRLPISEPLAIKLDTHLGIPFRMWMNAQANYDADTLAIQSRERRETVATKVCNFLKSFVGVREERLQFSPNFA